MAGPDERLGAALAPGAKPLPDTPLVRKRMETYHQKFSGMGLNPRQVQAQLASMGFPVGPPPSPAMPRRMDMPGYTPPSPGGTASPPPGYAPSPSPPIQGQTVPSWMIAGVPMPAERAARLLTQGPEAPPREPPEWFRERMKGLDIDEAGIREAWRVESNRIWKEREKEAEEVRRQVGRTVARARGAGRYEPPSPRRRGPAGFPKV